MQEIVNVAMTSFHQHVQKKREKETRTLKTGSKLQITKKRGNNTLNCNSVIIKLILPKALIIH